MAGWRSGTLTIALAATESEELNLTMGGARWAKNLLFFNPTTLPETVTVHVAPEVGGTYQALSQAGSDVVLTAAKAQQIDGLVAGALKLVSGVGVAAERVFSFQGAARDVR